MSMKLTCGEFVGLAYASEDELREFTEEILAENAKLRTQLADLREVVADGELNARENLAENAKLRELCSGLAQVIKNDDDTFRRLREIAEQELSYDFIGMYDSSLGEINQITRFIDSMAELGIEVNE